MNNGNRRDRSVHYYYKRSSRLSPLVPILIVIAIVVAIFLVIRFTGVGALNETNFTNQRNAKLRSEMQFAVATTNKLSRLGASSTTVELARIRQYVHGIELLNDLNVSVYGEFGRLYPASTFENIYSILDTYDAKLASGQKVNDSLNSLTEAINNLNLMTNNLLGFEEAEE